MKKLIQLTFFLCTFLIHAQVGIGTTNPDNSAKLDITAADKGVLIPRVSLIDVSNSTAPVNTATVGLMVFNTNASVINGDGVGFYYFNGSVWEKITTKTSPLQNIPFVTRAELDAITTPENGQMVYDSTDDVTLMWNGSNWIVLSDTCFPQPTTANAGPNQFFNDGTTSTTLAANTPIEGTGQWTIISGSGGSFANPTNPTTTFTGNACTTYSLLWTITSACGSSQENVTIAFQQAPSIANAGPNQFFNDDTTSTTLAANTPTIGTGSWTVVSGSGGNFADPTNPTTTFTGNACTNYTLRWTITACSSSYDNVNIYFQETPSTANAGVTIYSLNNTTVTLAATSPTNGTGSWSIVSGSGGSFADSTNPTTTFTGTNNTKYTLRWTVVGCSSSTTDNVDVFIGNVVGQNAYGGVIFYVDATGTSGLVTATVDQSSTLRWSCAYTNISTNGGLGTGNQNTINIIANSGCTTQNYAALACSNLSLNGYNDWYLPSLVELNYLTYINYSTVNQTLADIGGVTLAGAYWSSTQQINTSAYYRIATNPNAYVLAKSNYIKVRAIRSF